MKKHYINNIICLSGESNVGKTETLLYICDCFKKDKAELIHKENHGKKDTTFVFKYKNNNKFINIGIITSGDKDTTIEKHLNEIFIHADKIDYLFCACRSKGKTLKMIKSLANKTNNVYILNKENIVFQSIKGKEIINNQIYKKDNRKIANDIYNSFIKKGGK